jgi:hypothetical protein
MVASMPIEVVRVHVEGLESAQYHKADAAGRDGADMHALNVIGTLDAIGDVPTAFIVSRKSRTRRKRRNRSDSPHPRTRASRKQGADADDTGRLAAEGVTREGTAKQLGSASCPSIASSGRPRSPREPEVAAQLAIWGLSGCRAPDNPVPLDALAAPRLMFAGLRRRREAIRERETERDRLAEGWTPSRSPDEPQSSR